MPANTGYTFNITNSDGTSSSTRVDFGDMFVSKDNWYNAGLWSCGYNKNGQLGNGTTTNYSSPIQVGSLTNWKQVSCGYYNLAAIKTDGTLWTCGYNQSGQLGNGTVNVYYSSPIQVGSLTNWKQVECGQRHMAGIATNYALWTWGYNDFGQLGNGTTIRYSSPIQVGSLTDWKQVDCGKSHTVSIKDNGTLWSCGYNLYGQLGYEIPVFGTTNVSSPVQVAGGATWSTVDPTTYLLNPSGNRGSDNASYFVTSNNTLWVCGQNQYGQLGTGNRTYFSSPVQVGSLTNWKQIGSGVRHAIGLKTDGTIWSWGYNAQGQLGRGNTVDYSSPIQIGSLTNWSQISSGVYFSAAVKTDGTLWVWGDNGNGQLGNSTVTSYSSPIQVGALTNWNKISGGGDFWTSIKTDGTLWACGFNSFGELGRGSNNNKYSSPIQIGSLTDWTYISSGANHTLALRNNGTLWTWGYNGYGQLGNGTTNHYSSPIQVGSLTSWKHICSGKYYSAAVKTDGTLWTWGYNNGNLGNNNVSMHYSSPVQVGALTNWSQVVCGYDTTYAYNTNGIVYSWGRNNFGQLGAPSTLLGNSSSPIQVGSLTNWKQVSAGTYHTAAIKKDGTLWAWGSNSNGGLGNGTRINYSSPIQVGSLTNWKQVSINSDTGQSAAIKTDGTLWAWGSNSNGGLGNGTRINYSSPIQVGSLTNWKQVSCGDGGQISAVKTDGTLWSCGYNKNGGLGNGNTISYSSPIQIGSLTIWKQVSIGYNSLLAIQAPDYQLAQYVPGPPTGVSVEVINSTAVSVSFTAPTYNGNDPILSYEVSY